MRMPSLSFASHMHTVSSEEDRAKASQAGVQAKDMVVVPKIPSAMVALPARRQDTLLG